ncbi:TPA: hypothetical protein DDY47_02705 [candidate division WWE3 bacterium]|uniref:DUF5673 domain-containing protein n=3 Tax=Katanobacteria TaxID=422282 RepID=A0A1F4W0S5_UNCKA|nr:MAG: hypothetical protein UV27_C0027G0008 [candidate division WWE3 bacterium GW2011_GWA1_42_46]OGC54824.1 MAG: hypothetical protein A2200_01285 [candidate division WWE3 bacterium RIFOXYA1_FULL_41_11]OGC63016.1 MAG: hypothetical protein A2399_00440 [candidate division WWE3 bacterium RIFOXYB1_FULL_42_27]OGC71684.1 MAG: hypothetical protein A2578_03580 [candidate division WWE3 bacterium RIFOXYD1_FULL_42_24]OGC75592.1 MAG: hypothetical protein A2425_02385 [candidate division WWE3 bacterium RIFOX
MQIPYSKILNFFGMSNQKPSDTKRPDGFDPQTLGPKEKYIEWDSVVKAEIKEMNKRFSRTVIIIAVVIALLLVVMQEFGLIFVVASLIFFLISLNRLPEHTVHVEVSSHGIKYGDSMYYWYELKQFFFKKVAEAEILIVDTYTYLPGRLFFSFILEDRTKIKEALDKHINFLSIEPLSFLDKFFENVKSKFNI